MRNPYIMTIPEVLQVNMPRFQRGMGLRPVQRIKHVIDRQLGIVLGAQSATVLVQATDTPTLADTDGVITGAKVHGIYLKVEVSTTTGTGLANCYMAIMKNPGGNLTAPSANTIGGSDNKKYIIHQEMVMMQKFDAVAANPRILFNGVIKIPRGYSRFGPNDQLLLLVLSPGANIDLCIQCHYKEFR